RAFCICPQTRKQRSQTHADAASRILFWAGQPSHDKAGKLWRNPGIRPAIGSFTRMVSALQTAYQNLDSLFPVTAPFLHLLVVATVKRVFQILDRFAFGLAVKKPIVL